MLNAFGECEIVEVADVGEDTLLVHDETRAEPVAGVRAVAPVVVADDAHPGGCVPVDHAADVRERGAAAARRRRPSVRAPATSPSSSAPAPPGKSTSQTGSSRLRNTIPVRGFGAKNVVFSGMRRSAAAAARIVSTVTGRRSTAASALPFATCAATVCASLR